MLVSLIIRSKDEAPRLRLTLTSLAQQTVACEVIVVDDGSSDHTPAVIAEATQSLSLRSITHPLARGRSGASNAGAHAACGDVLLFLDGDTLAAPDLVARHAAVHSDDAQVVGRGETYHLRQTRFLKDPETGAPWPDQKAQLPSLDPGEIERLRVTRREIMEDFTDIERRATPGIYPGTGPRVLYELEMDALLHHPECSVLWAAASGSNLSVRRKDFLRAGGFNEALDINEHRELALRLHLGGARVIAVEGARTYHLTHRTGWRDPLQDAGWEETFLRSCPDPAVKLLSIFWASLTFAPRIPREARILSLLELEAAARGDTGIDYDAVRRSILALPELGLSAQKTVASYGVHRATGLS